MTGTSYVRMFVPNMEAAAGLCNPFDQILCVSSLLGTSQAECEVETLVRSSELSFMVAS